MRLIKLPALVALLLITVICGSRVALLAEGENDYQVEWLPNIIYYSGPEFDDIKHRLDLYRPVGLEGAPVLLFIHGGAWQEGDKSIYTYLGNTFARKGILTVIANYRLSPGVVHPAHVQDVARAFSWIRQHIKDFRGDPDQIFIMGHSAGGHLVALLSLDEKYLEAEGHSTDDIQGVLPISGVFDLTQYPSALFASIFTRDPDARRDASPITHVDGKQPPFGIIYAQYDELTLGGQAKDLQKALEDSKSESTLTEIANKDHITIILHIGREGDATTATIIDFIRAHLNNSH